MGNYSGFIKKIMDIMRKDDGISGHAQSLEQLSWMLFLKVYDIKEGDWELDRSFKSIIPEEFRWRNWARDNGSKDLLTGNELLDFVNNKLFPTLKNLRVTPSTPIKQSIVRTTFEDINQYMKNGVYLRQIVNIVDKVDLTDKEDIHSFGEIYETLLKELQSASSTSGEFYTPRAVTEFMASKIDAQIGDKMADFACGTGGFITSWLKELQPKIGSSSRAQEQYENSIYGIEKKQFPYTLCITNLLLHGIDTPNIIRGNTLLHNVLDYSEDDKVDKILMNPPFGGEEDNSAKSYFPDDLQSSETADLFMAVIMYRLKENGKCAVVLPDGFLFGNDNAKLNLKKKLIEEFNLHTIVRMPGSVFSPYTGITTNILFFDNNGPTQSTWFYRLDLPNGQKFSKTKNPIKREHFDIVDEWWEKRVEIKDEKEDESQSVSYKSKEFLPEQLLIKNDEGKVISCSLDLCGYPTEEKIILSPEETIKTFIEKREVLDAEMDIKLKEILSLLGDK